MPKQSAQSTEESTTLPAAGLTDTPAGHAPTNGDVPAVPDLPPPNPQELAALSDWCAYTRIVFNRLSMFESPYAEFMSDMLSIFEPLLESAKEAH